MVKLRLISAGPRVFDRRASAIRHCQHQLSSRGALACAVALSTFMLAARAADAAEPKAGGVELTVVTFNVMVDITPTPGVPGWTERKQLCAQVLRAAGADLIGLQEPSPAQVKFLLDELPGYIAVYYKSYPDATLCYKKDLFDELERGHWWLSPTPERVSIGFGNIMPRLVVWARLRHKPSGRALYVFNTHFDNTSPCQVKMAELCERRLEPFLARGLPMIFLGDFNTDHERGDYARLTSNGWHDAYRVSPEASETGRDANVTTTLDGARIDHIFYHGASLAPILWQRLESPDAQTPLSDHYPVQAKFRME
jgi:endonuclease/exonuclease/phosphatase family metal-dependent hydrolase